MKNRSIEHLVVVGASSGGIDALKQVIASLPRNLPAAVCIVVHRSPESPGTMQSILARAGSLPVLVPDSGMRLESARVYLAPPDYHLIVEPGHLHVARGPKENRFRPAIDPLFRSAAQVYGPRVIGVLLSGNLDDGTAGLWAIKQLGGVAVVQEPTDAMFPSMPESALAHVEVDYSVAAADIGGLLVQLTATSVHERELKRGDVMEVEVKIASGEDARDAGIESIGTPSPFACPDCHGVLRQIEEAGRPRFRCHTGHAFSTASLLAAANESIEGALWNAIRAIDESGRMLQHVAQQEGASDPERARHLTAGAEQAFLDAETLRGVAQRRGQKGTTEA